MAKASITVYLQALGGKFLGPNAYKFADINIHLVSSGKELNLPYVVTPNFTDDGIIAPYFMDGVASFLPIITTPAKPGETISVNYLAPAYSTIAGNCIIDLPAVNEQAHLTVTIPTPMGIPLVIKQPVLLVPQQTAYKVTVVVPGLLLTANTTNPLPPGNISVFVKMMCGCKVTTGLPTSFWTPADFTVTATVHYVDGTIAQYPLAFNTTANDSLFSTLLPNANPVRSVNFMAQQKSTANYGMLELPASSL